MGVAPHCGEGVDWGVVFGDVQVERQVCGERILTLTRSSNHALQPSRQPGPVGGCKPPVCAYPLLHSL